MNRLIVALLLATAGALLFGQGIYIHAKAMLAQVLLKRAFAETIATGHAVKPWPWADTWPDARITVKRIGASAIALAGSSGQALAFGPGHVERTADAGERGVAVYSAHRDTHFRFLKDIAIGDEIDVTITMEKPFATVPMARRSCGSINRASIRSRPATNSFSRRAGRSMRSRTDRCATPCTRR
jgi:sortase A